MYYVYNWSDSVLYIGVTSNLPRRLYEHRSHLVDGFSKKYNTHKLVYYEITNDVYSAISREKQLKKWSRIKKNDLIQKLNPQWVDLSEQWE
ncbi:MAG: GIY-YIG nuclease family protein [Ruminococcaceae bacterium]|nr:GIY-YIG nuclease family protein [Oscillospiraceae bacterium]